MCTLSWCFSASGYQLVFNRDEQKRRPLAQAPQFVDFNAGGRALMPIDPQGNGSWIAVNDRGLTLALLNFYQGRIPPGSLLSRGQIVRQAAALMNAEQVETLLRSLPLHRYPPFLLLVFEKPIAAASCLKWSGERLTSSFVLSPSMSSSIACETVSQQRLAVYKAVCGEFPCFDSLLQFHASHAPQPGASSVCMHRDDAHTVSQTQVCVDDKVTMNYVPGAPCTTPVADIQHYTFPLLPV